MWRRVCVCGHPKAIHQHYRTGSDCALCFCPYFETRLRWWRKGRHT